MKTELNWISKLLLDNCTTFPWMAKKLLKESSEDVHVMERILLAYFKNNNWCQSVELAKQQLVAMDAVKAFQRLLEKILEEKGAKSANLLCSTKSSPNLLYNNMKKHFVFSALVELGATEVFEEILVNGKWTSLAAHGIIATEKTGSRVINGKTIFEHLAGALMYTDTEYAIKRIEIRTETCGVTGYGGLAAYEESIEISERLCRSLLDLIPEPRKLASKSSTEIFKHLEMIAETHKPKIVILKEEYIADHSYV